MSDLQSIPCPDCGQAIYFNTNQLLAGANFACPNCEVEIAISRGGDPGLEDARAQLAAIKAAMQAAEGEH